VEELIGYVIRGIPIGCVYGLVAIGLVLTYKTSGVFNLAFGAQAYVSAVVFYELRGPYPDYEWPILPAFAVAVLVVAPLLGLTLEWFLFRHLRTAPTIAKLVISLGLVVALPALMQLLFGTESKPGAPTIWPEEFAFYRFGEYVLDGNQMATLIATLVSVAGLMLLFRYSSLGLRMRAVVESPRMTALAGINPDRVSSLAWMLSSLFAGLAGVLLAPLFAGNLQASDFTVLLVASIAAAALARLTSIPLALLGGLLLAVITNILAGYLPTGSVLSQGLRPSFPFVALFVLLIFWVRRGGEVTDPLSGVDPPPPGLAAAERERAVTQATWIGGAVAVVVGIVVTMTVLDARWLTIVTTAVVYSVIFLSITVITGMAGQISLCQATFAAIGGFTTAQLVNWLDIPVLLTVFVGALLAAVVGGLLAIPIFRLGGIYLALATLAFAMMFDNVFVPLEWVRGEGLSALAVPRPDVVDDDHAFFLFSVAVLAVVGVLVILVRQGTTGRYLDALRGSETAARAIGINAVRARVMAFALSAGIAGLGGGLLAMFTTEANESTFSSFNGLFWILLVVTLGARTVEGAVQAGLAFAVFPELLKTIGISTRYQFILFGFAAVTFAKHPEGILEYMKRRSLERAQRRVERRRNVLASEMGESRPSATPQA
jgi:branched-subunit amino acid ABC-type transport system permease component